MAEHPNVRVCALPQQLSTRQTLNGALADLAIDAVFHFTGEGREDHGQRKAVNQEELGCASARLSSAAVARPRPGALPLVEGPGHVVLQGGAGGVRVDADEIAGADVVRGGIPCRL